jgi:hypothetical protein
MWSFMAAEALPFMAGKAFPKHHRSGLANQVSCLNKHAACAPCMQSGPHTDHDHRGGHLFHGGRGVHPA